MKQARYDLLAMISKMGPMSAEEIAAHHPRTRSDTLDLLVRQRMLSVKMDADGAHLYRATARARIAIGLEHPGARAPGRTHVSSGNYQGIDMSPVRGGANDYQKHPSRMGDRLIWPGGRVEVIKEAE